MTQTLITDFITIKKSVLNERNVIEEIEEIEDMIILDIEEDFYYYNVSEDEELEIILI